MGEVWRAKHKTLPREVAVKFIRPNLEQTWTEQQPLADRFLAEASAIAGLRSPHSILLYDYGITNEGALYYAMELIDGVTLDHAVRSSAPMPAERVIHILSQICLSLSEAHSQNLVHRDIKPENIMLANIGGEHDIVKVLDFGLVGAANMSSPAENMDSSDGQSGIVGTPGYIAPENLFGGQPPQPAADIYA